MRRGLALAYCTAAEHGGQPSLRHERRSALNLSCSPCGCGLLALPAVRSAGCPCGFHRHSFHSVGPQRQAVGTHRHVQQLGACGDATRTGRLRPLERARRRGRPWRPVQVPHRRCPRPMDRKGRSLRHPAGTSSWHSLPDLEARLRMERPRLDGRTRRPTGAGRADVHL